MIKSISWDAGGVLIRYSESDYFNYLSKKSGKDILQIEKIVDPRISELEARTITTREFNKRVSHGLGIRTGDVKGVEFFKEAVRTNEDVIRTAKLLKRKGYEQSLISNIEIGRYKVLYNLLDLSFLDYRFISAYLQMRKPEKPIFEYALSRMGRKGEEVVFIDDRKVNVEGAVKAGLNAILFINHVQLIRDLTAFGVSTE